MEKDILRAVADHGMVVPGSPTALAILAKYPDEGCDRGAVVVARVTHLLDGMVDEGVLSPIIASSTGKRLRDGSCGELTVKGWERLYRLEHPVKVWMKRQWFPLTVAIVSSLLALASIIATFVRPASA